MTYFACPRLSLSALYGVFLLAFVVTLSGCGTQSGSLLTSAGRTVDSPDGMVEEETIEPAVASQSEPEARSQSRDTRDRWSERDQDNRRSRADRRDDDDRRSRQAILDAGPPDLPPLLFDFDSARLSAAAKTALRPYATWLKESGAKVRIEGFTDSRGTKEYNLALGRLRALSVYDYLAQYQVPFNQMSVVSYGEERPLLRGNNERVWRRNRRATIVLL